MTVHVAGPWELEYVANGSETATVQRHAQRCLHCDALLRTAPSRADPPEGYAPGEHVGLTADDQPIALRGDPTVEKECHASRSDA